MDSVIGNVVRERQQSPGPQRITLDPEQAGTRRATIDEALGVIVRLGEAATDDRELLAIRRVFREVRALRDVH